MFLDVDIASLKVTFGYLFVKFDICNSPSTVKSVLQAHPADPQISQFRYRVVPIDWNTEENFTNSILSQGLSSSRMK